MSPHRAPIAAPRAPDCSHRCRRRAALFALPLAAAAALAAGHVAADEIVVSSCASSGAGSLFDAIQTANTIGAGTNVEIQFSAALSGHSVALDAVTLTRSMTITGLSGLKIVGTNTQGGALITVEKSAGNVQFSSLSITSPQGIGIANGASLSLTGTSVFNCGGKFGIESDGSLNLLDSKVTGNAGNGIVSGGNLSVFSSELTSNGGSGITANAGCVNVYGSHIDSNGGIGISSDGSLSIDATSVSCNQGSGVWATGQVNIWGGSTLNANVGDGLTATGPADVQDSTFSGNHGNGVSLSGGAGETVARSTLDHNRGDGVDSSALGVTVVNDTLAFNMGAGLGNDAGVTSLLNDTIAYNAENGIINNSGDANGVTVENTIAALNGFTDLAGGYGDIGHNLLGTYDADGPLPSSDVLVSGLDPGSLGLSSNLTNDGGLTAVLALSSTSAAIDRASSNFPGTDQRGALRPQPTGGLADIGAYEYVPGGQPSVGSNPAPLPSTATLALGLMAGMGAWEQLCSRLRRRAG